MCFSSVKSCSVSHNSNIIRDYIELSYRFEMKGCRDDSLSCVSI